MRGASNGRVRFDEFQEFVEPSFIKRNAVGVVDPEHLENVGERSRTDWLPSTPRKTLVS